MTAETALSGSGIAELRVTSITLGAGGCIFAVAHKKPPKPKCKSTDLIIELFMLLLCPLKGFCH